MRNRKATDRPTPVRAGAFPRRRGARCLGTVLACCLLAPTARAQSVPDGNGIKVGETRVFPELRLDYLAYDNVYRAGIDPTEASAVQLSPLVRWQADRRLVELEARYDGNYSAGSEDILDFAEHRLGLTAALSPSSRTGIDAYLRFDAYGEERRLLASEGDAPVSERVDIDRYTAGAAFDYGASGARGNLRIGLDIDGYDPEGDQSRFVLRRRQFTRIEPYGRFSLRFSPDTRLLFEARFADVDRREGQGIGNTRVSLLTGLGFATSGAFGGDVRVGVTRISYDDVFDDDNTARVAASLFFAPTSFSRFDLALGRDFDPRLGDTGLGTVTSVSTSARLDWRYAYSDRIYHRADLFVEDNESECPLAGNRQVDVGFELNVRVRRWIEFGAGVEHEIDRIEDCGTDELFVDPTLLETDATRLGVHVRAIL